MRNRERMEQEKVVVHTMLICLGMLGMGVRMVLMPNKFEGSSGNRKKEKRGEDAQEPEYLNIKDVQETDYLRVETYGIEQSGQVVEDNYGNILLVSTAGEREELLYFEGETKVLLHVENKKFIRDFRFLKQGDAVALKGKYDDQIVFGVVLYPPEKEWIYLHNDVWGYYHDGGMRSREVRAKDLYELVEHIPASRVENYEDLGYTYAEYKKLGSKSRKEEKKKNDKKE